jgi:hypothetical protein
VLIDPDFVSIVNLDDFHVFLTSYSDYELTVSEQPSGFHVRAKDAASSNRFSWRVLTKRKDIAGPQFEPVTTPPEPTLPPVPDVWTGSASHRRM